MRFAMSSLTHVRLKELLAVLPLTLTVVAAVVAVFSDAGRSGAVLVPLTVASAAWGHFGWRWLVRHDDQGNAVVGYLAGLWLLDAGLVLIDPVFVIAAIAGLIAAAVLTFDWRGFPAVFAFSVLLHVVSGPPESAGTWAIALAVVVVQTVLLGGSGMVSRWVENQNEQRRQAVGALERAAAENALLQERLVDQARTAGVAEERARLARDLHDTLVQGLVGVLRQVEAAQIEPSGVHLERAASLARSTLDDARRSLHALRPASLADGLVAAVEKTTAQWAEDMGVEAVVRVEAVPVLSRTAEEVLLRAVGEALSNVGRHADAGRVVVTLTGMDDGVVLDVHDDGRGFDPGAIAAGHLGLSGMRERVRVIGGRMEIESTPGQGTALSIVFPLS
ncbi:sensor histidine kinase [Actinoplanes sp. CA-131856]